MFPTVSSGHFDGLFIQNDQRRMSTALVVAVLLHALMLSVTLGGQSFGLSGLKLPWKERRLGADDLQVILAPLPAPANVASNALSLPAPSSSAVEANPVLAPVDAPAMGRTVSSLSTSPTATPLPKPKPAAAAAPAPAIEPLMSVSKQPTASLPTAPVAREAPIHISDAPAQSISRDVAQAPVEQATKEHAALDQAGQEQAAQRTENLRRTELMAAAQREAARQEQLRIESARTEQAARDEAARLDAERQELIQQENLRRETLRQEQEKRAEQARQDAVREEQAKAEALRQEAVRQEAIRQDLAKQAQLEQQRQERARQEAARQEQIQQAEKARVETVRQEQARQAQQEAQRLEALRQEQANQAEMARQAAAKQEQERADAARQEVARQAAQQEAFKQEQAKKDQALRDKAKQEVEREERLKAIGKQLDQEAAQRNASSRSALPSASNLRRGWLFGRADPNGDLILYAEAMSRKIERNMTFDMVREVIKQPHNRPTVTIAVRADGSVEKVTFVTSSGVAAIDDAIRKVIASQAPYGALPPALARQYDVIEIRRTWIFDMTIRLE